MSFFEKNPIFDDFFIAPASSEEVSQISRLHYRSSTHPYAAAWKLCHKTLFGPSFPTYPIGIITYALPLLNCAARKLAAGDFFCIADKHQRLNRLNRNVRRISRVIIDPRFRGMGLAARLVRMTMPLLNVPMIETVSVMGSMSRFFERAGMRRIELPPRPQARMLADQLRKAGIPETLWTDAAEVWRRIQSLSSSKKEPLQKAVARFLGPYGRRRQMAEGLEQIRFVLSRLNARPSYFVWFNPANPLPESASPIASRAKNAYSEAQ
jgi:GNAT superfamily N-acetyltransferase